MADIKAVACVGAGLIGSSWATLFSREGYPVRMHDFTDEHLAKSRALIAKNFAILEENGIVTTAETAAAMDRVSYHADLAEALDGVDLIQENIAENLEKKQALLAEIDAVNTSATYASSSSSIMISLISQKSAFQERCIGGHPFNPPHIMPLVEITKTAKTDPWRVNAAYEFYKALKREPIILQKEVTGFIGNRLQFVYTREAIDLVMNGVCTVEDIDKASLFGLGLRYGVVGLNVNGDLNGGENGLRDYYGKLGPAINDILRDAATWDELPEEYGTTIGPEGVEKAKAARPKETGNTREEILAYRDKMLIALLRLHGKL